MADVCDSHVVEGFPIGNSGRLVVHPKARLLKTANNFLAILDRTRRKCWIFNGLALATASKDATPQLAGVLDL
jgi:hypothetical protein